MTTDYYNPQKKRTQNQKKPPEKEEERGSLEMVDCLPIMLLKKPPQRKSQFGATNPLSTSQKTPHQNRGGN